MTGQPEGPKLRTLDDLQAAMSESAGGKCDRCRRESATLKLTAAVKRPQAGRVPTAAEAKIAANVCEGCAVDILAVVGRAVGQVR